VQEVQVNKIGVQSLQAFAQISVNRFGSDARFPRLAKDSLRVHDRVTALGDQNNSIALPALLNPASEQFFAASEPVNVRSVNAVAACVKKCGQQFGCPLKRYDAAADVINEI
jgi:hypothetical protein